MPFRIVEITETRPDGVVAKVSHQGNPLTALISNQRKNDIPVGESFEAEIGFDRVLGWKPIDDFEESRSGIWQEQDGIHLLGRVHNILDYGDGKTIMDVYIQNGSEFFTLSSDAVDDAAFDGNDGLEITVGSLYLYPKGN